MEQQLQEMMRNARGLANKKQSKIASRNVRPENDQGQDGDMQMVEGFLYVKNNGQWFEFVSQPDRTAVGISDYLAGGAGPTDEDGYVKLVGGIMIQWGVISVDGSEEAVTFPTPFPTALFNISCTPEDTNDTGGHASGIAIHGDKTTTGFSISTVSSWEFVYWIAIGH